MMVAVSTQSVVSSVTLQGGTKVTNTLVGRPAPSIAPVTSSRPLLNVPWMQPVSLPPYQSPVVVGPTSWISQLQPLAPLSSGFNQHQPLQQVLYLDQTPQISSFQPVVLPPVCMYQSNVFQEGLVPAPVEPILPRSAPGAPSSFEPHVPVSQDLGEEVVTLEKLNVTELLPKEVLRPEIISLSYKTPIQEPLVNQEESSLSSSFAIRLSISQGTGTSSIRIIIVVSAFVI